MVFDAFSTANELEVFSTPQKNGLSLYLCQIYLKILHLSIKKMFKKGTLKIFYFLLISPKIYQITHIINTHLPMRNLSRSVEEFKIYCENKCVRTRRIVSLLNFSASVEQTILSYSVCICSREMML